jgi:hypothetical protein
MEFGEGWKRGWEGRIGYIPCDVGGVKHCQPLVVLQVGDAEVVFEANDLGVADVGAVEERTEEEQGEDGEDSVSVNGFYYYVSLVA